ncbi:uncharacterized protein LOC128861276 isoform X1 [Anastrepha ludens]|uniref:uncharacterized protein LOC128861276 isoform X1 n=1 Tax=Anastrepha ludens TaxID=28586 RepID=UPI0023AEFF50|nr:uncharacterized protein LOC128861276 isoform X1 [Anastrepha ludens]XP_053955274.1 uncharacterized protein LOC128861276 isoform X1 [Anastrepha ludens]
MWKMFEDTIYCSECTNFLEPPPKFEIPAPPRPPYIGTPSNCKEKVMSLKIQKAWDHDKCEAIPIFDTSFYKRQSLQTSAVIAVFCLLFILVALILSLFVCKNKRKVQNVLPCKELIGIPHINGPLPIVGVHSVTHEVPNMHSDHQRLLVMLHHHKVEVSLQETEVKSVIHPKGVHYPSSYTMTRTPPLLVSSYPGPTRQPNHSRHPKSQQ